MSDFDAVLVRHGETFIQAILEDWERANKIRHLTLLPLEDRWAFFLRVTDSYSCTAVAA